MIINKIKYKNCPYCVKDCILTDFYENKDHTDGLASICKKCHKKLAKRAGYNRKSILKKIGETHVPAKSGNIRQNKACGPVKHIPIDQYLWDKENK